MEISEVKDGSILTVTLNGRFDALAAIELEKKLSAELAGVTALIFDFAQVPYIASAGLRVILQFQKTMSAAGGSMKLIHVAPPVREVFEITRLIKFITLEA
ncbi:MAG: STAS domain-containing protein [Lentisphaeria bacterium]|nr:STAS domain-containing protein [Lentisphaeria bacterium]